MDNTSLADIAAVVGNDREGFGNNWLYLIALFFIFAMFGGGLGFGGGAANAALTQTDALMNAQFNNLDNNVQAIANRQYEQANNLTEGICELGTTMMTGMDAIRADIATNMYQTAMNISNDGDKTRAAIASLSDRLYQNEINALQSKVNQLEAQNNNAAQSAALLGAMGQWRAYPPCNPCCCYNGTQF